MGANICKSVLPIPQYENTCWLNAILMCLLKSQNSRKYLINNLSVTSKSSKLIKIIHDLLLKTYISAFLVGFFGHFPGDRLLVEGAKDDASFSL